MTFLPAITLLLIALGLYLLARYLPQFNYFWLVAVGGVGVSWVILLVIRFLAPLTPGVQAWLVTDLIQSELVFVWDEFAWPFSLALSSLTLSVILTEVVRAPEGDWASWTSGLVMTGFGLLTIMAGNLFTLLLGFSALDLISSYVLFSNARLEKGRGQLIIGRLVGTGLVILTGLLLISNYSGESAFLLRLLFFLGCSFRLGLFARRSSTLPRGLGLLFDLIPAFLGLVVLFRMTTAVIADTNFQNYYAVLVLIGGLIAGFRWAVNRNLEEERSFWVLGIASMAATAVLLNQPQIGIAWGLGLVYGGGLLFLYRFQASWQIAIPAIGFFAVSGLPYSPMSAGYAIYQAPFPFFLYLLLLVHGLLLAGFIRQVLKVEPEDQDAERWVLLIFPAGLVFLLGTYIVGGLLPWQGFDATPLWPGFFASLLGGLLCWVFGRLDFGRPIRNIFRNLNDLIDLVSQPLVSLLRGVAGLMSYLSVILEGQGGILWALVLIVLILSIISQVDLGGFPLGN